MSNACCDLYQFQTNRIHLHLTHGLRENQTPEPVEQVIGKAMQLEPVGIHNHGGRTDRAKVEAILTLFDKVFHRSAIAVKTNDVLDWKLQVGHNECVQMIHLAMWFLDLYSNTARLTPGASLVIEFTIDNCVINGIVFGPVEQDFIKFGSQFA